MGSIRSHQPGLSGRRIGAKISADVPCGKVDGTKAGDLNVREILADASPFPKDLFHRSSHRGHF